MKTYISFSVCIFIILALLCVKCKEDSPVNVETEYLELEYSGFMKLPVDEIADSLAKIMDIGHVLFNNEIFIGFMYHDDLKFMVEKGYEYLAGNGDKIRVWIGKDGKPLFADYIHRRGGDAENLTLSESVASSLFMGKMAYCDVFFSEGDSLDMISHKSRNGAFFEMYYMQSYNGHSVKLPYFFSEIEGDTNKINFLSVSRYYTNLQNIKQGLSDAILKEKARKYFQDDTTVISISPKISLDGYYILNERLCFKVGNAVIDKCGSYKFLYMDIQNGEIVEQGTVDID